MKPESVRLLEDYQKNWVILEKPFKMDEDPRSNDPEHNFVRYPPIAGRVVSSTLSVQKILRCLGFRLPHRAFMVLELSDIYEIRRRLASNIFMREAPGAANEVSNLLKEGKNERAQALLMEEFTRIFRVYREKIDAAGFTVFEGIMNPIMEYNLPGLEELEVSVSLGTKPNADLTPNQQLQMFAKYYVERAPTERQLIENTAPHLISQEALDLFASIRDGATSDRRLPRLHINSRLVTTKEAVTDMLEDMEDTVMGKALLKARIVQEVGKMQLSHWLRLPESTFDATSHPDDKNGYKEDPELVNRRRGVPELYCPDTGCRLLMNAGTAGKNQVPHVDYYLPDGMTLAPGNESMEYPPYFSESTTTQPVPLWVLERSHMYAGTLAATKRKIAETNPLRLIYIPRWSLFLSRGDVIHAGGSGRLAAEYYGDGRCPRLHLYQGRRGVPLPDSINDTHAKYFKCFPDDEQRLSLEGIGPMLRTK